MTVAYEQNQETRRLYLVETDPGLLTSSRDLADLEIECRRTGDYSSLKDAFFPIAFRAPERISQIANWTYHMLNAKDYLGTAEVVLFKSVLEAMGKTEDALMERGDGPEVIFENVVAPRRALTAWWLDGRDTSYEREYARILAGDGATFGEDIAGMIAQDITDEHMIPDRLGTVDLTKSFGSYIFRYSDEHPEGRFEIDFFAGFASLGLGWSPWQAEVDLEYQRLLRLVAQNKLAHSDLHSPPQAALIKELEQIVPAEYSYWFAIEGGAAAVENAIKTATDWKVRKELLKRGANPEDLKDFKRVLELVEEYELEKVGKKVIGIDKGFHGRTAATMAITRTADPRKYALFCQTESFIAPHPEDGNEEETIRQIEDQLKNEDHGIEYAAIVVEPVQGEGGYYAFSPKFLKELRRLADEYDVLLIHDDIQAGTGRTDYWWPHQRPGFEGTAPDIIVASKIIQGGFNFARKERIDEVPGHTYSESSRNNSTWGGNPVDFYRAAKHLQMIREKNLLEHNRQLGRLAEEGLGVICEDYSPLASNPRAIGTMIAFDVPSEKRGDILKALMTNGLLALGCGGKSIRIPAPLNTPFGVMKKALEIIEQTLAELAVSA